MDKYYNVNIVVTEHDTEIDDEEGTEISNGQMASFDTLEEAKRFAQKYHNLP